MRLVCPNCGAQYEVDDRVIPDSGRDVQCSACGHGWYQMPKGMTAEEEEEPGSDETASPEEEPAPVASAPEEPAEPGPDRAEDEAAEEEPAPEEVEPKAEPEPEAEDIAEDTEAPAEDEPAPAPDLPEVAEDAEEEDSIAAAIAAQIATRADDYLPETDTESDTEAEPDSEPFQPPRRPRSIDEGVRSVLREEAQREIEAREAERPREPGAVETQPDLGLDAATWPEEERRRDARARMAKMRGFEDEPPEADFDLADEAPEPPVQGRDLFPDIEEINSTLDSHNAPANGAEPKTEQQGRGFSRGFFLIIFIAALLLTLYLVAPQLANTVPALKPALTIYVDTLNGLRSTLDALLQGVIAQINGFTGTAE